jgi:hypothetical protein
VKGERLRSNGTIFSHPRQPAAGLRNEQSNLTPLSRKTGKIVLDCPICFISFERYACWAKRKKVCYCSKACADEAKRRPQKFTCVVCATDFTSIPSMVGRLVTCSEACRSTRRRELKAAGVLLANPKRHRGVGALKLNAAQVSEIESSTDSAKSLAAKHGVSDATIYSLWRSMKARASVPHIPATGSTGTATGTEPV